MAENPLIKLPLLGDEAIAQAAIDGGASGVYAYPGTPSTEILEYVINSKEAVERNIHRKWSANEKTALEAAIGMSYAGKRAMVCMKHVGLNVAADPFMNVAITGANGGLLIVVADDPSMHSSQNEQDSRYYGKFAQIPFFDPSDQQAAYDITYLAFELSEKLGLPILIRLTTRLSHSRAGVICKPQLEQNKIALPSIQNQFNLLPVFGRPRYQGLLKKQDELVKLSEESEFNTYIEGPNNVLGIVASGIGFNYLMENYPSGNCDYSVVKINQYPIPFSLIERLESECDKILVIEEGYPFVEETIRDFNSTCREVYGKLSGTIPRSGELNADVIATALGKKIKKHESIPELVKKRPPALCAGCGHADVFNALNEGLGSLGVERVFSDIGCYTLGALPPYSSISTCLDMGASITMAKGACDAGLVPSVAVLGDSTFTHSGMTGLIDCVLENAPVTIIILDNDTVAMTGGQTSSASGRIEHICQGIGVAPEHIRICTPLKKNHDIMVQIIKEELAYDGVSVVIARRECIQVALKRKKLKVRSEE